MEKMTRPDLENPSSIQIRTATPADTDAIAGLSAELGYETTSEDVSERLGQLLNSQEHGIFVAVDHPKNMIGWVHVFTSHRLMTDSFADLGGLIVKQTHRGFGIGNQLLLSAEEWAISKGLQKLKVRSNVSRERAHKFYISKDYNSFKSQKVFEKTLH
jgi:GNAT superfamily N-acetyltransferase